MKPLIVGEAPGRKGGPPIDGAIGRRLADMCGMTVAEFKRATARTNVLSAWPGPCGKGSRLEHGIARSRADGIKRRFIGGRIVVLLGKRTASAFGVRTEYFRPSIVRSAVVVVVPHPSGVNRALNDARTRRKMEALMRNVVEWHQ